MDSYCIQLLLKCDSEVPDLYLTVSLFVLLDWERYELFIF